MFLLTGTTSLSPTSTDVGCSAVSEVGGFTVFGVFLLYFACGGRFPILQTAKFFAKQKGGFVQGP